jgi:type III restriction enzyme
MRRGKTAATETLWETNPQKALIDRIQTKVSEWAASGYPGASELSRVLLSYWFGEPHLLGDGRTFFKWHTHQQRAIETVIYLYEAEGKRRVEEYASLVGEERKAQTAPWAKIGLQMATGSGKTKVMSLLMVWAHLHWQLSDDTKFGFGGTQILLAPNLIVLERLLTDFSGGKIFYEDPLLPPDLKKEFRLQVVTPDNVPSVWLPSEGYLVVSNIHKLYPEEKPSAEISDDDPIFDLFNPDTKATPTKLDLGTPRLLDFVQQATTPILVFNDEAHNVHDEVTHYRKDTRDEEDRSGQAWNRVLLGIQERSGLSLQCDLSATLFEESSKQWFRHTVYDFPLQQAIKNSIVKQPILCKFRLDWKNNDGSQPIDEPIPAIDESATNAFDKYTQLIQAGIAEWKKEQKALDDRGIERKALLFIVCNNKTEAGEIAKRLEEFPDPDTKDCPFAGKVIEIHIGKKEMLNEKEWQKVREDIALVDRNDSPYTAVVSVMMLKEGWDVRNVKVIVPLRPCDSRQLTEQLLGRGLRRMFPPVWTPEGELKDHDRAEGLYIIRHPSFERIIKNIADIVEEEPDDNRRPQPLRTLVRLVEDAEERARRDVPIAQIVGAFETEDDWVERIGRNQMPPLAQKFPYVADLKEIEGIIKHEGATGDKVLEEALRYNVQATGYASIDAVVGSYAEAIRAELRVSRYYEASIKGIVKAFLERCTFDLRGIPLSLDAAAEWDEDTQKIVIDNICRPPIRSAVIQSVSKIIGVARSGKETPDVQIETRHAKDLPEFETSPSPYALHHPEKSVHTACHFDSGDELKLATLLEEADDVAAWLWNDQSGVGFRIQYSYEGRMPYYYPDFLVRLTDGNLYIIESKGSIRERDRAKQARAERYADILREATGENWHYLFLINDGSIGRQDIAWWRQQGRTLFRDLVKYVDNAPTGRLEL